MMLSSSCSHRLLSLLDQALLKCKEEEKQLEQQLRQWRVLLDNWDVDNCEPSKLDDVSSKPQETQPSPEDLQEVELLNKALQKALRVRETSKTDLPVNKTPAPPSCSVTKEKTIEPLNKLMQKGTKPMTYQLNPPYKTIPDRRRVQQPRQRSSIKKSTSATPSKPPATKHSSSGDGGQLDTEMSTTGPCTAPAKPMSPPSTVLHLDNFHAKRPCTLKEKGATLKLPAEYQQAYMKSNRLWEKFCAIQDNLPASRPSFIQKLQTTFAPESPKLSLFEIEEETARLQREVRSWQQNVDRANNWQGTGLARWQNYRSLLLLEALQEEVAKYQSELQNLQLVAKEYRNWAEKHSINTTCLVQKGCPTVYSKSPPVLVYNHLRELHELTCSRLRVLELQQKIHVQKVLGEELLIEAESWSQSAPTCLLLRAIYTQLCEGGDTFPVLVQDDG
ncbi:tubulin epsilon and delta complex protein 2 [Hyla sarda]|uniref:tubulin epsilon and delta complex protein 2 n=1 Tax=Hyla sarda TaxID=327740 RepID=UPI0024C36E8E|nr:tubulin epsilon and delta complex protein 2 [Hyla sarda]XP_056389649.1 tubulin epsilon and delta complex protein 2 [Hyla sarda]XP_056389650.1 tubulin epsilon and delta complex protein 2 [Hyla sarda]XP_056389651.1 tubulin epsilon and delta complex protein 2 [Hyla sarda]XP_056389652.1 tubulin epsilon and delta complex protein 2 [Hyla sarda]XP_056389653.1 tubulin epsilon and delta complex protein 2 [Hyla sarda]XP_056389654.1 tubulin epsilon and delta complex protein 2 [Hyla sarda]XP_05638965